MITNVELHNFKCFQKLDLPLSNLNLFSGINSMGKSTLIQAFLLLRQSFEQKNINDGLSLNGNYVKIGLGQDLLYSNATDENIEIELYDRELGVLSWQIKYDNKADYLHFNKSYKYDELGNVNLFNNHFEYLSAERIGPKLSYAKSYYETHVKNQVGIHGEYAVHYLNDRRKDIITNQSVLHPNESEPLLLPQVERWLDEITPGVKLNFENYEHANSIGLMVKQTQQKLVNYYSTVNIGFGITYVLPVIIALLKSQKDDLIIIENPEAHLHPKGQRKMGELISRAANGGVQILVETHSDHVLNGIRLSVKKERLNPEMVNLYYFSREANNVPLIENPKINGDGRLNFWPEGFFDEWDKAIDEMF